MEKCFIIQPFDKGKFDSRFEDVFKPAIKAAELEPYRIDQDLSVRVPIEEIENGIKECSLCFAEITTDNPNVWYELGFAFAVQKDVILVCSDERQGKYPFDIQHRQIINYKTSSKSDFEILEKSITQKILAIQKTARRASTLNSTPVVETEGLKSHEIAILILLMENTFTIEASLSTYELKNGMNKSGYTDIATTVGLKSLQKYGMVDTLERIDEQYDSKYIACKLTDKGENWILSNQDQLQFRATPSQKVVSGDDLPF